MAFLKPQSPMTKGSDYFYPLTTSDQVIMDGGYRLNEIVGKTKKSTIILYANGWSAEAPYCYSIAIKGLSDKVNMKMLPHFPEDFEDKQLMKEEIAKISFASRENNILTFECWDEIPAIDLLIDIEIDAMYPIKGASIEMNYSVVGGIEQPTKPTKNMIWVNTDQNITNWVFSKSEPKNLEEGMIWFTTGNDSAVSFFTLAMDGKEFDEVYPISAKQYVSGAWVTKDAMSYQGGKWKTWILSLFDYGKQSYKWKARAWSMVADVTAITPSVTKNTDGSVKISVTVNSGVSSGVYELLEDFDLTNIKTLTADIDGGFLCVVQRNAQYFRENAVAWTEGSGEKTTLDVSGIKGKYDIVIGINHNVYNSGAGTTTVTFKSLTAQ